jgi:hypothetical protein
VWLVLALSLCAGLLSAMVSAWLPVYLWSRSSSLEWRWLDPTVDGGMPELETFGYPGMHRSNRRFRLCAADEAPTRGMLLERLDTIDEAASIDQDEFVIGCEALRAGWPWTTMRGGFGTIAFNQREVPDPLRYRPVWSFAVPIALIRSPFSGFFVAPPGSALVPTFFPLRPTWGFPLHAAVVAGWITLGAWLLDSWRRDRRLRRGQCPSCAYVLGGVPRCPECGRDVPGARAEGLDG